MSINNNKFENDYRSRDEETAYLRYEEDLKNRPNWKRYTTLLYRVFFMVSFGILFGNNSCNIWNPNLFWKLFHHTLPYTRPIDT